MLATESYPHDLPSSPHDVGLKHYSKVTNTAFFNVFLELGHSSHNDDLYKTSVAGIKKQTNKNKI